MSEFSGPYQAFWQPFRLQINWSRVVVVEAQKLYSRKLPSLPELQFGKTEQKGGERTNEKLHLALKILQGFSFFFSRSLKSWKKTINRIFLLVV